MHYKKSYKNMQKKVLKHYRRIEKILTFATF